MLDLSALAGAETLEGAENLSIGDVGGGVGEVVGGVDAMKTPPPLPRTHRGEPLAKFRVPPPTTHIDNQGGETLAKSSAHPRSLG